MLKYDERSNLLMQAKYKYRLQDVTEPNLYRELFDYESIPKIAFNHRIVPMHMPDEIWMSDTTFRDGQQSTSPFTVKQIVDLFKLLSRLGGPKGLVRQSEFFVYTKKDREAVEKCKELGLEFPEVTCWIRADAKDFELVKAMGVEETGMLMSCSDYHIFKKMNMTRRQAVDKYLAVARSAIESGIRPRCHLEDITRADYYGFVVPLVTELMALSRESGVPIRIRACDTLGFGVTYPGVAMPRSVQGIMYGLRHYAGVPEGMLEWHGHNDFYKVVTNSTTAWLYGCSSINCSMLGIGERTGNCPLEAMVIEYASLKGTTDGMDLTAITDIAEYFENEIGMSIPPRTPFVGRYFNSTRAGIHADGLLKNEEIYNIFDTATLLNRPATVAVDSHSGLAGIAHWMNGFYKLTDPAIGKRDPIVAVIKGYVDELYAEGRNTVMGDSELDMMVLRADPEMHARLSELHKI